MSTSSYGTARGEVYVRFVVTDRDHRSDQQRGIFTVVYDLERDDQLAPHEQAWFRELEQWFDQNLERPDRLAWSSRPNAPKRAITSLKMSAKEHLLKMRELAALLEEKGVPVEELRTVRPGYVVYDDEHQVAAIPFPHETP